MFGSAGAPVRSVTVPVEDGLNRANIVNPDEAQCCLLYAVVVAGKSATFADGAMRRFLAGSEAMQPFEWIAHLDGLGVLESKMREARMGCYTRLVRSYREIAKGRPDLLTASPAELERFHGVGPKTARFAIMCVRRNERYAALDTHVLKWLRFIGEDAPKATPSGEKYAQLEAIFIREADTRNLTPRLLDAMIWEHCSQHRERGGPQAWPAWLQKVPAAPPAEVLASFKSWAA